MTTAELALSDRELDARFELTTRAETAGELRTALATLEAVIDHLTTRGKHYQYLHEWRARLLTGLGDHLGAELSLRRAEDIAHVGTAARYRMQVMSAEVAISALELERAEHILAEVRGDAEPLGAPIASRRDAILAWLGALRFADGTDPNLALLRVETALTIVGLWFERGKYRSALALLEAVDGDLVDAAVAVRIDQVRLLEVELRLEAGQIAQARTVLASIPDGDITSDRVRLAVVRARIGLMSGDLASARACVTALEAAPHGDPDLFASAAATRVAILVELNLWQLASQVASQAADQLGADAALRPLVALLRRSSVVANARGRSVMAVWELPLTTQTAPHVGVSALGSPPTSTSSRFTAIWTELSNQALEALERDDLVTAARYQAQLEATTREVESDYIAARVRLSAAMLAYCRGPTAATFAALSEIADAFHVMGAVGAEAQATRYAAWAAAKQGRHDEYVAFARRSGQLIDSIAARLDAADRTLYLLNKWSGRDEVVAARLREVVELAGGREGAKQRRAYCEAFREIDALTHWPIDQAFGEAGAEELLQATADVAAAWVRAQISTRSHARGAGLALRSPWSLWRVPRKTLILHYHVLADRTYLFRIAKRHIDLVVLPIGRVHLRGDLRAALAQDDELEQLAQHTGVADAMRAFPDTRHLVIVPHDAMANVPFAALPVEGAPLCTRVAISQIDRLARVRPQRWIRRAGRCASIGLSSYEGAALPDLRGAEREAYAVAALAGRGVVLTGTAATCEGVLAALRDARRVHVAAHGEVDRDDPGRSGIVLRDGDGFRTLTLLELRRADAHRVELATLATCRSAESALLPGGARICLPTALLDAGVRGVVAELWPVEDEQSVAIMAALYRHLRTARPALALARTQREMLDRPCEEWAGLVFYGNQ